MSDIRILEDRAEQLRLIKPIYDEMGKAFPAEGCVVFAEFDEAGAVVSFQVLQNCLFAEGLWSRDKHANLRSVWHAMRGWLKQKFPGVEGMELLVMADSDKVGRACEAMRCEPLGWRIFKRKI